MAGSFKEEGRIIMMPVFLFEEALLALQRIADRKKTTVGEIITCTIREMVRSELGDEYLAETERKI